jgi:pimeloyl-ACP methyl ester carboxylesterase
LPWVPEAVLALAGGQFVRRAIAYGWKSPTPISSELLEHYTQAYADPARLGAMLAYYRAATRPRMAQMVRQAMPGSTPPPRSNVVPLTRKPEASLVIWGASDPVLPLPVGETVVRDLGAATRLIVLPGVGHFSVDEAPELVTEAIANFLREGERPAAKKSASKETDQ